MSLYLDAYRQNKGITGGEIAQAVPEPPFLQAEEPPEVLPVSAGVFDLKTVDRAFVYVDASPFTLGYDLYDQQVYKREVNDGEWTEKTRPGVDAAPIGAGVNRIRVNSFDPVSGLWPSDFDSGVFYVEYDPDKAAAENSAHSVESVKWFNEKASPNVAAKLGTVVVLDAKKMDPTLGVPVLTFGRTEVPNVINDAVAIIDAKAVL